MSGIDEEGAAEALPELCDLCGATVADDSEWYASVRDSSVVHAFDPKGDGRRLLVGCTSEHLKQLIEQYKRRPFIDAELWAGQIGRAIGHHPQGISADELAEETGLNPAQIELGVLWQNFGALRWQQQFGRGEGPTPDTTDE